MSFCLLNSPVFAAVFLNPMYHSVVPLYLHLFTAACIGCHTFPHASLFSIFVMLFLICGVSLSPPSVSIFNLCDLPTLHLWLYKMNREERGRRVLSAVG